jgi:hypothetical protein
MGNILRQKEPLFMFALICIICIKGELEDAKETS